MINENSDDLVMGEELRIQLFSINGLAKQLRADNPQLNRVARKREARRLVSLQTGQSGFSGLSESAPDRDT